MTGMHFRAQRPARERLLELLGTYQENSGFLPADLGREYVSLARDSRNLVGLDEPIIKSVKGVLRVVLVQCELW